MDEFYNKNKKLLKELKIFLTEKLEPIEEKDNCDNTLKYTKQFIKNNKLNEKEWIEMLGMDCDCEILNNCLDEF